MKQRNDLPISDAIKAMLDEYKLSPQLNETRIKALWEQVMGKTISTYTSHISLRKGTLYLTILSAPLKQELSFAREKIAGLLNEALGEDLVRDVVIK